MKTQTKIRNISLSLSLSLILISSISLLNAQTVYIPAGTSGIGNNPTNQNVGIGVSIPNAKLDIYTSATVGGINVRGRNLLLPGEGTNTNTTPFALRVEFFEAVFTPSVATTTALLDVNGKMYLGDFSGIYTSTNNLNTKSEGIAVHGTGQNKLAITYNDSYANLISWNTNNATAGKRNLAFAFSTNLPFFNLTPEGKVGIGTQTPSTTLHVSDQNVPNDEGNNVYGLQIDNNGWRNQDFAIDVNTAMGNVFSVTNNGYMYLGPDLNREFFADYRLYVQTGIRTERIRVDIAAENGWADFVFEDDYELMPIAELEIFIKTHKHLPNVPSEKQVRLEGIDLAEMNAILLRQIEELTLRVIELEKKSTPSSK